MNIHRIKSDDILILQFDRHLSDDAKKKFRDGINEALPDLKFKFAIFDSEVDLTILSTAS